MNPYCNLSDDSEEYLKEFNRILKDMILGMTQAQLNDSISHNFIVQMIPHHKAAIEMSENILKYTNSPQLKKIADNIILEQTKSIENMRAIKCSCDMYKNSRCNLCSYQKNTSRIFQNMFSKMGNSRATNNISCDFIREMIPHHRGAVQMCKNALNYKICPELVPILKNIISSQTRGISQMESLMKCMNCEK